MLRGLKRIKRKRSLPAVSRVSVAVACMEMGWSEKQNNNNNKRAFSHKPKPCVHIAPLSSSLYLRNPSRQATNNKRTKRRLDLIYGTENDSS